MQLRHSSNDPGFEKLSWTNITKFKWKVVVNARGAVSEMEKAEWRITEG